MVASSGDGATQQFTAFAAECLNSMFKFMPPLASGLGLHEYDGQTPDLSKAAVEGRIAELRQALARLEAMGTTDLDPDTALDYDLLHQGLDSELFRRAEQREHTYNPMSGLSLANVNGYIKHDYAPIEERVRKLAEYERGIPRLMEQVVALLEPPLATPIIEVALQMSEGQAVYLGRTLPQIIASQITDEQLLAEFNEANGGALQAVDGLTEYLKGQLANAKEDFAIGAEMFSRMLAVYELVDLPLERVLEVGRANLEANKAAFIETARLIDPTRDVREVARQVSLDHPTAEGLIPETANMLEEIRQYLIDRDIVTVPSEVRCQVKETPEFMRWGFAFMDPPGPFEERATDAYYYVTPVEADWTPQQAEEWLRRFNYSTLRDVSVHETYPGHYVHFQHAARVTSPIRKAYSSYAFVEGWAHYCEQMMVEEGYRAENHLLRFAQLSEALLRNCRYVASILMHTGKMTLAEATQFFVDNGFMEELPAQKEALRGTFDPGYLNYTLGKLMLLRLRDDLKAIKGAEFSLKSFHDSVLALGYPPVPLVRKYMLEKANGSIL